MDDEPALDRVTHSPQSIEITRLDLPIIENPPCPEQHATPPSSHSEKKFAASTSLNCSAFLRPGAAEVQAYFQFASAVIN